MKPVSYADFDFGEAGLYRKVKPLAFADVRQAVQPEEIVTFNSSGLETRNIAQPGDYILKGSSARYGGGGYIIRAERFPHIYEADPEMPGFYRHCEIRRALMVTEHLAVVAPWGETQYIHPGGVVVEADGDVIYGIDKWSFIRNYARVGEQAPYATIVRLDESLEAQLAKVRTAGLQNHQKDIEKRLRHKHLFDDKRESV